MLVVRWSMALAGLMSGALAGFAGEPSAIKTLDALLQTYKSYELPLPPAEARLVRVEFGTQHYALGFHARDPKTGESRPVFVGTGPLAVAVKSVDGVDPTTDALPGIDSYVSVELAVQCHVRGWTELASKVLEEASADRTRPPAAQLARSAWEYWLEEFRKPTTDRAKVARVLKVAIRDQPDEFTARERSVLDALELSLVPGMGKPGTVGALIDGLIEVTTTDRFDSLPHDIDQLSPAYVKLARTGFDAVPDLIAHMNDERLTRAVGDERYTVADVVGDLLQSLAGQEVSSEWARSREGRVDKRDIEAWWADARTAGEEAYLGGHVFGLPANDNVSNRIILDVLAHKYPKRLPELYRRMIKDRPGMLGWELAGAVAGSTLPKETKRDIFLEACRCPGTAIRVSALWRLVTVDRPAGLKALATELDRVPEALPSNYRDRPEMPLVNLVMEANDPIAWAALDKTLRRVNVRFRVALLDRMAEFLPPEGARKGYLALLGGFLDDAALVTAKTELRNVAAKHLAEYLEMNVRPKPDWGDAEWEKFRKDVKKALATEGIR